MVHRHEPHLLEPPRDPSDVPLEVEELVAMRDQLAATPDVRVDEPTDRAQRATRSASAYLDARRARLRRELRALREER